MTEQTLPAFTDNDVPRRRVANAHACDGHSLIEVLIVLALIGAVTSFALPQLIAERRLSRSVGITREILTQMRHARQLAMSQRQAFTFQYNHLTKQISIIDHNSNPGGPMLIDPSYPNTAGSSVISAMPLAEAAISTDINYGIPTGAPTGLLPDRIAMTALFNNQLNITFQPDGSVINAAGDPQDTAMFFYNASAPKGTASAISVMGAAGRVKIWRYKESANLYVD